MRSVETEGATIDEAIARALELLRIERDKVDVDILENSARGLLGLGSRKARIRATVRTPLSAASEATHAPVSQETARAADPADAHIEAARTALEEILRHLGLEHPEIDVAGDGDGGWRFAIPGQGAGLVIGRHGQTLDAIEHLLKRIAARGGQTPVRIVLDVEGYRQRRQESLEESARHAAEQVRATGRPILLAPMSPRDRRIVHLSLSDERGVSTHSEGEGVYRRVRIVPSGASRPPRP